jgi:hypothetical protein
MTYGKTAVASDDRDNDLLGQGGVSEEFRYERRRPDDIEGGDTKDSTSQGSFLGPLAKNRPYIPLRVVYAMLLEYLRNDGDGGVDGVGNDKDESLRGGGCDTGCKVFHDSSVDLQRNSFDIVLRCFRIKSHTLNRSSLNRDRFCR